MSASEEISIQYRGKVAVILINRPQKLNAMNQDLYYRLATAMHEVAAREDVFITVLAAKGRFFSAGADVSISSSGPDSSSNEDERRFWLKNFVSNNLHITHAFYTHPKILVTALNGPVVGLSAALVAFSDFVYAAPHTFLLTPFTSLGLVAEGNASVALVQRLGISKANEALIQSKRITCEELVHVGFVNKVIDVGGGKDGKSLDSDKFLDEVLREVDDRMGDHLNADSMVKVKALIRGPERETMHKQGVIEVFGGLERFLKGIPQKEFAALASGTKKHKL